MSYSDNWVDAAEQALYIHKTADRGDTSPGQTDQNTKHRVLGTYFKRIVYSIAPRRFVQQVLQKSNTGPK